MAFVSDWLAAIGLANRPRAAELDWQLHREGVVAQTRRQISHPAPIDDLPDGAFVTLPGKPTVAYLVLGAQLLQWTAEGYRARRERPSRLEVTVLTPRPTVAALAAGYRPQLHPSATAAHDR